MSFKVDYIVLFVALPLLAAFAIPIVKKLGRRLTEFIAVCVPLLLTCLALWRVESIRLKAFAGNALVYHVGSWFVQHGDVNKVPLGINLVLDSLSILLLIAVNLVALGAVFYSIQYMRHYTGEFKYYSLFMLMLTGMNGVVLTGDLFNLFVFLEIASIASYALVAFGCESEELEASFKYMILGTVASTLVLFGIALVYGSTGALNMAHISAIVKVSGMTPGLLLAMAMFLLGFGLKAALVPFHAWLPDAHPSAPAPISAVLSGILIKAIGMYVLIRLSFNVFGFSDGLGTVFLVMAVLSMIIGAVLALKQKDMKRMMAYSSISQMGYVLLGFGLGTPLGIIAGLFHLFNHAIFKSLLFLCSGAVEKQTGTRNMEELGGLSEKMPATSLAATIGSLSISGVPPFNGFFSKALIVLACIEATKYGLAVLAVVVGIITLGYYLRMQRLVFFGKAEKKLDAVREAPRLMVTSMLSLAVLCLVIGLCFSLFMSNVVDPAARVVNDGTEYSQLIQERVVRK